MLKVMGTGYLRQSKRCSKCEQQHAVTIVDCGPKLLKLYHCSIQPPGPYAMQQKNSTSSAFHNQDPTPSARENRGGQVD